MQSLHMLRVRSMAAGLLLCAACQVSLAASKPEMTWLMLNLPPGSMPVDGQPSDGISDIPIKLLMAALPDFAHRVVVTNTARAMMLLAEGSPACFATAAVTPDRERLAYFTLTYLIPPLHLIARADAVHKLPLNSRGEVRLADLIDRTDLRGIVIPQRSYSPTVDALLAKRRAQSNVRDVLADNSGANILKMLALNRGDYTIEYDFVLSYQLQRNRELSEGEESLKSLPIADSKPFNVGIACPHTEWGRTVITKLDALLAQLSTRPEYRNAVNRWLTPAAIKRHQKAQAEFFARRARPTDPSKYQPWIGVK
ncbi:MAG TPA: TIGR02285 family protein [Burkholderiaceae bacterium]